MAQPTPARPCFQPVNYQIEFPWSDIVVPDYRVLVHKRWKIAGTPEHYAPSYFMPMQQNPVGYGLWRKEYGKYPKSPWMSLTMMERQSHMPHADHRVVKGTVVVGGLGLGMYLFNVLSKPAVEKVIVLERDQTVIELFKMAINTAQWAGFEKLEIIHHDIMEPIGVPEVAKNADHLYVDIWYRLGLKVAMPQTKKIFDYLSPKSVSWWGQELDFGDYVVAHGGIMGRRSHAEIQEQFEEWHAQTDMPVIGKQWPNYGSLCLAASASSAFHEVRKMDPAAANHILQVIMWFLGATPEKMALKSLS